MKKLDANQTNGISDGLVTKLRSVPLAAMLNLFPIIKMLLNK